MFSLPNLMLLAAFETSSNVTSMIMILASYSSVGICLGLRFALVLGSSLNYSANSSNNSGNEDGSSPFRLFTKDGDVFKLSPLSKPQQLLLTSVQFY